MNLRRKRAREQMMQVVEGFVREQTVLLAYLTYVQENMEHDIHSTKHQIINNVIVRELRGVLDEILMQDSSNRAKAKSHRERREHKKHVRNLMGELELMQEESKLIESVGNQIIDNTIKSNLKEIEKEERQQQTLVTGFEECAIKGFMDLLITEMASLEVEKRKIRDMDSEEIYEGIIDKELKEEVILTVVDERLGEQIQNQLIKECNFEIQKEFHILDMGQKIFQQVIQNETQSLICDEIALKQLQNDCFEDFLKQLLRDIAEETIQEKQIEIMLLKEYQYDFLDQFITQSLENIFNSEKSVNIAIEGIQIQLLDLTIQKESLKSINECLTHIHSTSKLSYDQAFYILNNVTQNMIQKEIIPESIKEIEYTQHVETSLIKNEVIEICKEVIEDKVSYIVVERSERDIKEELIDESLQKQAEEEELAEQLYQKLLQNLFLKDIEESLVVVEEKEEIKENNEVETTESSVVNINYQDEVCEKILEEITIQNICQVIIESINGFVPEENFTQIDEQNDSLEPPSNIYTTVQQLTDGPYESLISNHTSSISPQRQNCIDEQYNELKMEQACLRLIKFGQSS